MELEEIFGEDDFDGDAHKEVWLEDPPGRVCGRTSSA
jgi:hypothetical protein